MKSVYNRCQHLLQFSFSHKFNDLCPKTTANRLMSTSMTTPLAESSPVAAVVDSHDDTDPKTDTDSGQSAAKRLKTDDNNGEPSSTANTGADGVTQSALTADADLKKDFKREKLRKWALLLSYCGHRYYGMQRQTKYDTPFPHTMC
jgi:hypothetical protein